MRPSSAVVIIVSVFAERGVEVVGFVEQRQRG